HPGVGRELSLAPTMVLPQCMNGTAQLVGESGRPVGLGGIWLAHSPIAQGLPIAALAHRPSSFSSATSCSCAIHRASTRAGSISTPRHSVDAISRGLWTAYTRQARGSTAT